MKDINEMTRAEFEALPILRETELVKAQGIVLLPTTGKHDSGYGYFYAIPYLHGFPIGKLPKYDVFNAINIRYVNVDCLYRSKLMRIIFCGVETVSVAMHNSLGGINGL